MPELLERRRGKPVEEVIQESTTELFFTPARAAEYLKTTRRTLLRWESDKKIPPPQRVKRGKLEYRAYSRGDIEQIRLFVQSKQPGHDVVILENRPDGVPVYSRGRMSGILPAKPAVQVQPPLFPGAPTLELFTDWHEAIRRVYEIANEWGGASKVVLTKGTREHVVMIGKDSEAAA